MSHAATLAPTAPRKPKALARPSILIGAGIVLLVALIALAAPWLGTVDPQQINPIRRMKPPSADMWFGTDMLGRDVWSRALYGARVSLVCGIAVAALATSIGLLIGVLAGFSRLADRVLMRVMDGLMAIPAILIAVAFMALTEASLKNVVIAITIAEVPRVARLMRGMTLGLKEMTYVEAARSVGTPVHMIVRRHIVPNCLTPLIVQGTFIAASAIITEAVLSFIGAGTPAHIPSWGNMMAEARSLIQVAPWILLAPGLLLSLTVLGFNILGDGLRDALDPRMRTIQ